MRKLNRSRLYEAVDERELQRIIGSAVVHSSYYLTNDLLRELLYKGVITDNEYDNIEDKCIDSLCDTNTKAGKLLSSLVTEIVKLCK